MNRPVGDSDIWRLRRVHALSRGLPALSPSPCLETRGSGSDRERVLLPLLPRRVFWLLILHLPRPLYRPLHPHQRRQKQDKVSGTVVDGVFEGRGTDESCLFFYCLLPFQTHLTVSRFLTHWLPLAQHPLIHPHRCPRVSCPRVSSTA